MTSSHAAQVLGVHGGLLQSCGLFAEVGSRVHFTRDLGTDFRDVPNGATFPLEKITRDLRPHWSPPQAQKFSGSSAIAVSGLDTRMTQPALHIHLERIGLDPRRTRLSDLAEAAHLGAFVGEPGILVRAGHCSSAHIRLPTAPPRTVGGWGFGFGDLGSAPWIGRHAIRAVANLVDDMAGPQERRFAEALLDHFNFADPPSAFAGLEAVRRDGNSATRKFLYGFGEFTVECAQRGYDHARLLVDFALARLLDLIRTPLERDNSLLVRLRLSGSLFERNEFFRTSFLERAFSAYPRLDRGDPTPMGAYSPIVGIGLLALGLETQREITTQGASFLEAANNERWARPGLALLATNRPSAW